MIYMTIQSEKALRYSDAPTPRTAPIHFRTTREKVQFPSACIIK